MLELLGRNASVEHRRNDVESVIELPYGSEEWYEFRKTHIGGSDAAAILGLSPWKTISALYDEKTGLIPAKDISNKKYVDYGKKAEEHIAALFALEHEEQFEVELVKDIVYVNDFMMASLDARLTEKSTKRKGFFEVKTGELRKTIDYEKWNDKIPDYYYPQILHYFNTRREFEFGVVLARLKEWFYNPETEAYDWRIVERPYYFERIECLNDMEKLLIAEMRFDEMRRNRRRPSLRLPEI